MKSSIIIFIVVVLLGVILLGNLPHTTTLIGVIVVLITGVVTHIHTQSREIKSRQFPQKLELCELIMDVIYDNITAKLHGTPLENQEKKHIAIARMMLIWGSDEMILAWENFKRISDIPNKGDIVRITEDLFFAMRKELGHENNKLQSGDIFKTFVSHADHKEIDKVLE